MDFMKLEDFAVINPTVRLQKGKQYPYVSMSAVNPSERYVRYDELRDYKSGGGRFKEDDILFARITPCLENGKIAQYKGYGTAFGSTEFIVFRNKTSVSDLSYIFYLVSSSIVRKPAEASMTGASGRQRADLSVIKSIEVPAPPLPTQRKIASVLSAYDDLIETNTRRIQALEEAAQALYREWFVEFRFPGHEDVAWVESELGMIPSGWEVGVVSEFVEINPSIKVPKDVDIPYIPMANLSETSMIIDTSSLEYRRKGSGAKFQNNDVLLARITPSLENGKTGFVQFLPDSKSVAIGSTEFYVMRSSKIPSEYIYLFVRVKEFRKAAAQSMVGASGRQRVQKAFFDNYLMISPDKIWLTKFEEFVMPIFEQVYVLHNENQKLREARDGLLPRLVSGEVDVSELDVR